MLYLDITYEFGSGPGSNNLEYMIYTEEFCSILQDTFADLKNKAEPVDDILEDLTETLRDLKFFEIPENEELEDILCAIKDTPQPHTFLIHNLARIFMMCKYKGIAKLQFISDGIQGNRSRLDEINFPYEFIPAQYVPYFQPDITDMAIDMSHDESLFIKKVQMLYYAFQWNDEYTRMYQHPNIQRGLSPDVSYDRFWTEVGKALHSQRERLRQLYALPPNIIVPVIPAMPICELFFKYHLPVIKPRKADYEQLIRRIAMYGEAIDLQMLIEHPVLDVVKVDLHQKIFNGKNLFDMIDDKIKKFPDRLSDYLACHTLLEEYSCRHDKIVNKSRAPGPGYSLSARGVGGFGASGLI